MNSDLSRRRFIKNASSLCAAGCCLMVAGPLNGMNFLEDSEVPDPKLLNYCGYKCPTDCKFLSASKANDAALKHTAYEEWKIKEYYGIEFDADKIFCFGCKNSNKPEGVVLSNCTVRSCAIKKGYDGCIECNDLVACDKDLWARFPDFKKYVEQLQQKYREAV